MKIRLKKILAVSSLTLMSFLLTCTILGCGSSTVSVSGKDGGYIEGALPSVIISSPIDQQIFGQADEITFNGYAFDPEDGRPLLGTSLVWKSSIDGEIGLGNSFTTDTLSVGTHTITLTATNSAGNKGTAKVSLTVASSGDENFPSSWEKTFSNDSSDDLAHSVQQTADGGYIAAGYTSAEYLDYYVVKLDGAGNKVWDDTSAKDDDTEAYCVQQTADGGYIVAGYIASLGPQGIDCYLLKLDPNGAKVWDKSFGGSGDEEVRSIQQTSDGGYIVAGYSAEAIDSDLYVAKLDPNGAKVWDKAFGGDADEEAESIQQTSDGGYIVAGYQTDNFNFNGYILKLDPNGDMVWDKAFGGDADAEAKSIQQTSDGDYIVAGYITGADDSFDAYLIKLDPNGDMLWDKAFGGSDDEMAFSMQQTSDGGYIVAGGSFGSEEIDVYIVKVDKQGNEDWSKIFGGTEDELATSIQQTSDGGYITAGYRGNENSEFYVLKIDSDGNGPK